MTKQKLIMMKKKENKYKMTKQKITKQLMKEEEKEDKLNKNLHKYKNELENIEKKWNGLLSAEIVLNEAKKENSPLHNWFDWEDSEAGEKWRFHQARMLINSVKVKITFDKGIGTYRKYLNVNVDMSNNGKPQRFYVSTQRIMKTKTLREQVLKRAIREAEYWERTYREYQELNDIFKGINKTKKKLDKVLNGNSKSKSYST